MDGDLALSLTLSPLSHSWTASSDPSLCSHPTARLWVEQFCDAILCSRRLAELSKYCLCCDTTLSTACAPSQVAHRVAAAHRRRLPKWHSCAAQLPDPRTHPQRRQRDRRHLHHLASRGAPRLSQPSPLTTLASHNPRLSQPSPLLPSLHRLASRGANASALRALHSPMCTALTLCTPTPPCAEHTLHVHAHYILHTSTTYIFCACCAHACMLCMWHVACACGMCMYVMFMFMLFMFMFMFMSCCCCMCMLLTACRALHSSP
jgi:hypothetical protein